MPDPLLPLRFGDQPGATAVAPVSDALIFAEQVARRTLLANTHSTQARLNLAVALEMLGRNEETLIEYLEAVSRSRANFDAALVLAAAYRRRTRWTLALEAYSGARELSPDDAHALGSLGEVFYLSFFAELTVEERSTIEAVATDMASGYREAVKEACPHAALVYDMFHAIAKFGREVIDRVRVDESKKQERAGNEAGRQLIKGSRHLLLKNERNLSGKQRERLDLLLAANENLNLVYVLRDQLKRIWTYAGPGWARRALEDWCAMAGASGITPVKTFARSLCRHAEGIINHCRYPIHTGRLEGVNNKIKVIKRMAYGFRDDDYFILKIKGAFPGDVHAITR